MILLRRFLPVGTAGGLVLTLELLLARQTLFWLLFPLVAAFAVLPVGVMVRWKFRETDFWRSIIPPAGLAGSSIFCMMFVNDRYLVHLFIVVTAFLVGWFLENLYQFLYHPEKYQPYALEHISLYLNLLSVFFLFSALYAARIFLSIPLLYLLCAGGAVSLLFSAQLIANLKITFSRGWSYLFVVTLVLLEVFVAVSLLPTTFFVAGLLIAIPYYLMMNITRHTLRQTMTRSILLRNVAVGAITLVVALLTAPWV